MNNMDILYKKRKLVIWIVASLQVSAIFAGCSSQKHQLQKTAKLYYKASIEHDFDTAYKIECPQIRQIISYDKYEQMGKKAKVTREAEIALANDHLTEEMIAQQLMETNEVKTKIDSILLKNVSIEGNSSGVVYINIVYLLPTGQKKVLPFGGNWNYEDGKWCHTDDWPYGWD